MTKNIIVKRISQTDIEKELQNIDFDNSYIEAAKHKYNYKLYKIFNLRPPEASILKQLALSLGTDCAVHKKVITADVEYSDAILGGTVSQLSALIKKLRMQPFKLKVVADILHEQLNSNLKPMKIGNKIFDWNNEKYVMGILNLTPDSFSDGGKYSELEKILTRVEEMITQGVDIIDIGAESTRPFAESITAEEEQKRLLPVLKEITKIAQNTPISIDTRNSDTALKALELGASIINDISAGKHDNKMLETIAKLNIPYVLTHSISNPTDMQINPTYNNVVDEIYFDLYKNIEILTNHGMSKENIIIDVGLGFGKTTEHNFELCKHIDEFTSLNQPILVGHSRKNFLSSTLNTEGESLDTATAVLSTYLLTQSTNIVRVHDIEKNKLAINLLKNIK